MGHAHAAAGLIEAVVRTAVDVACGSAKGMTCMAVPIPRGGGGDEATRLLTATLRYPQPGIAVCSAAGEVDSFTASLLCERLHQAVSHEPRCVILDLSTVTFFGAAGVTVLHAARSRQDEQQRLVLVAAGRPVARVLDICEVAYPRYSELEHALAACDQVISP